jgi:hypothetical protein
VYYRDDLFAYGPSNMVGDVRPEHHELEVVSQPEGLLHSDRHQRTECRIWPFSSWAFSAASSSISVVSVPFDVTGEGPTISLPGLIRCAELGLMNELGRRDWESGVEEELPE